MEVIQDELQKNNVRIDIETLTEHIEYITITKILTRMR